MKRYLSEIIKKDALAKGKMAFISGARQVGKSTLAKGLLQSDANYFLYDEEEFRRTWSRSPEVAIANRSSGPIVLDEIHKDRLWKRRLKGIYDRLSERLPIIVSGSARLDYYRRGGDSLLGRYLPYRLHPLSVAESADPITPEQILTQERINFPWWDLISLGGFPEPLLGGNEAEALRWSRLRIDRLALEDSRDFLNISDQQAFRNLIAFLPERVGSLLSIHALHEDIGKAYGTTRSWFQVLDLLYFCFTVKPYAKKIARANRAEPKLYLYDILRIPKSDLAKRLENLTGLHLLKMCHFWTDTAQGEFELRFVRNKDGREVDFVILRDSKPWMLIECKSGRKEPAPDLLFYAKLLRPQHVIQLLQENGYDRFFAKSNVRIMSYEKFLSGLV
jgi:hypothetical protein